MTDLIEPLIKKGSVFSYPIYEYWLDIGKMEDFNKAENEYTKVFLNEKALIVGFGSAGQNHNKILNKLSVKTYIYSRRKLDEKISFPSLEEALKTVNPDYVIIANETSEHLKTLKVIENFDVKKVLVEKPLFQNFDNNLTLNTKIFL